jgi:formyl-CoA transferase
VLNVAQVLEHAQAKARGLVTEVEHSKLGRVRTTGRPINLPAHPDPQLTAAPVLGEHTDDVLRQLLGTSDEQLREWRNAGVVS